LNTNNLGVMSEIDRHNYTGWHLCYLIISDFIQQALRFLTSEGKDNENEIEPQVFFVKVYLTGVFLEK